MASSMKPDDNDTYDTLRATQVVRLDTRRRSGSIKVFFSDVS